MCPRDIGLEVRGGEGREKEGQERRGEAREMRGKEGEKGKEGRGGEEGGRCPPTQIPGSAPDSTVNTTHTDLRDSNVWNLNRCYIQLDIFAAQQSHIFSCYLFGARILGHPAGFFGRHF